MGGIFGGLLALIQQLGGVFLFVLIGSKAWKPTESGELFRTGFGGALFGVLSGSALSLFVFSGEALIGLSFLFMVLGILFAFVLYGVKRVLDRPTQE